MVEIQELKALLKTNNHTCVLATQEKIIVTSYEKGVMPLYHFIQTEGRSYNELMLADKIIGKAAAYLAIYAGVKVLDTIAISEGALPILKEYGVEVTYEEVVPYIYNRMRNGQCPMESALETVSSVEEAWEVLDTFIKNREKNKAFKMGIKQAID